MFDPKHDEISEKKRSFDESKDANKQIILNEKLSNPNRIELIKSYRKHASEMFKLKTGTGFYSILHLAQPYHKEQKVSKSISGLKPITLKDMDLTRDHIYKGYVMEITFIEDAITGMTGIATIIQDNNFDIQRCVIYNFEHDKNECLVQQTFGFGCKWSLINPYMRMASDRKPAIRIDDINSIIKSGDQSRIENMCRYCAKSNAKSVCSRCKKAYYCHRKCQTNDWNVFKHKLICVKTNV